MTSVVTVTRYITLICYCVNLETLCSGCKVNALINTRGEQYNMTVMFVLHTYTYLYTCVQVLNRNAGDTSLQDNEMVLRTFQ